ncbi:hypothetical protein D3C84_555030 [compost metagenome]
MVLMKPPSAPNDPPSPSSEPVTGAPITVPESTELSWPRSVTITAPVLVPVPVPSYASGSRESLSTFLPRPIA